MASIKELLTEMNNEAVTTRKFLERIPVEKFSWKPHEKSMSVVQLASHIAELPSWVQLVLTTHELDFASSPYQPTIINDIPELLAHFEKSFKEGKEQLEKSTEADLLPDWTLRSGDQVFSKSSKYEMIRTTYCQVVHHRAQLGVYLRLLNIPIPGSYGPSADEQGF
jgi:uncharacterized damage-inducible protein DinB